MDYEYTPLYYSTPCQVKYYDRHEKTYRGAICYHEYIIFGNGSWDYTDRFVLKTAEETGKHFDEVLVELNWVDISNSIYNEEK